MFVSVVLLFRSNFLIYFFYNRKRFRNIVNIVFNEKEPDQEMVDGGSLIANEESSSSSYCFCVGSRNFLKVSAQVGEFNLNKIDSTITIKIIYSTRIPSIYSGEVAQLLAKQ
jgi:hypothetical protein